MQSTVQQRASGQCGDQRLPCTSSCTTGSSLREFAVAGCPKRRPRAWLWQKLCRPSGLASRRRLISAKRHPALSRHPPPRAPLGATHPAHREHPVKPGELTFEPARAGLATRPPDRLPTRRSLDQGARRNSEHLSNIEDAFVEQSTLSAFNLDEHVSSDARGQCNFFLSQSTFEAKCPDASTDRGADHLPTGYALWVVVTGVGRHATQSSGAGTESLYN